MYLKDFTGRKGLTFSVFGANVFERFYRKGLTFSVFGANMFERFYRKEGVNLFCVWSQCV